MKKNFYSHLVNIEAVYFSLHALDMNEKEKQDLMAIVESSVHHLVIDTVLSELPEKDKEKFMTHLVANDDAAVWKLLRKNTKDIDKKIVKAVEELKKELRQDIHSLILLR